MSGMFQVLLSYLQELSITYQTIPNVKDPEEEAFGKHCGKRRKCWLPAFSPFSTMYSTLLSDKKYQILSYISFVQCKPFQFEEV